jgi:putative membrane protein
MRFIRSTASALFLAASLVGTSAWASGADGGVAENDPATKGATNTQPAPAHEQGIHNAALKPVDQQFLNEAFDHSIEQLAIGEIATRQGTSDQVKKMGAQIVTDETEALKKLSKLAEKNSLTLPKAPPAQDMATVSRLTKLEGKQFDDAFLAQVRARDNHALTAFQQESKGGKNDDLKTYASEELPVIRGQLDQLKTGVTNAQPKSPPKAQPPKGTTNKQPSK